MLKFFKLELEKIAKSSPDKFDSLGELQYSFVVSRELFRYIYCMTRYSALLL